MSHGAQLFRQNDVTKACKGAIRAGLEIQRVEIDRAGKIVVFAGKPANTKPANERDSAAATVPSLEDDLDRELAELEARNDQG
jgi:hypothetical protein